MNLYRRLERILLSIINLTWKWFILIHEYKKITGSRKIYKLVVLTKEQKNQIDKFYIENYGKKVPYMWHRLYTALSGSFDYRYLPEYIYTTQIELLQNRRTDVLPYENKGMLSVMFGNLVKVPTTILICSKDRFFDGNHSILSKQEAIELVNSYKGGSFEAFIKISIDSMGGHGVRKVDMCDGKDLITNQDICSILEKSGPDYVIQEPIKQHHMLAELNPSSVNTIRVVTYMTHNSIKTAPLFLRIGRMGSVVDNVSSGGLHVGVSDEGILYKEASSDNRELFLRHPDTNVLFENYQLPCIPEIRNLAVKLHQQFPMLLFASWDLTLDEEGSIVLIEMNLHSQSVGSSQITTGKAIFGEDTEEILQLLKR